MRNVNQKSHERGAILVEFAILLPLFLFFLMGTIEFGLLFYNKQVVTNSSREGARAGIAHIPVADIENVIKDYCADRLITFGSSTEVLPNLNGYNPTDSFGTPLTVTVSYNYTFLVPKLLGLGTTMPLIAESMMRMERPLSP